MSKGKAYLGLENTGVGWIWSLEVDYHKAEGWGNKTKKAAIADVELYAKKLGLKIIETIRQ